MRTAFVVLSLLLFCLSPSTVLSQEARLSSALDPYSVQDISPFFAKEFEQAYGQKKLPEISYDMISFSPEGGFLAVAISQITIGDPEQVWMIDLKSHKIRLVCEPVIKDKIGLHIEKLSWESEGILLVTVHRIDWLNQSNNRTVSIRATIDESEQTVIPNPPRNSVLSFPSPSRRYEITLTHSDQAEIVDVRNRDVLFKAENAYWERVQWLDDNLFVFIIGHGHGNFTLNGCAIKPKTRIFKVDTGSWALLEFVVNPTKQAQIAYIKHLDGMNNAIIFYDLNTNKEDRIIYLRRLPWRIALSNKDQMAFSARDCEAAAERFTTPARADQHTLKKLCVMQLPDRPEKSYTTSFECVRASSEVERTICKIEELADDDVEMASIYRSLLSRLSLSEKNRLRHEQLAWLKDRNTSCGKANNIADCLRDFYKKRIETLKSRR